MASPLLAGCPFGTRLSSPKPLTDSNTLPRLPTGKARVKLLYEEYVHLPALRAVWDSPITASPMLEPCFSAACHGMELCFLLLAEFIADERRYVAKRPRIERVADDIASQCNLLVEVIDGELEEEGTQTNRLTLTQDFPFPGAPPTRSHPSHSPGLARLEGAIYAALPTMTMPERNSLIKLVINLTSTAFGAFQRWSVGLGLEPQLNALRKAVGLTPLVFSHTVWLDYLALVRPEVVERTLTGKVYTYHEDFFFRTVHLGTECWARVALARLQSAKELATAGSWHVAAARILQASRILDYLGSHVMLLTSMNLRDYLLLKVELEGTSGEGSAQVKMLRPAIKALFPPLAAALLPPEKTKTSESEFDSQDEAAQELALAQELLTVYEFPDRDSPTTLASHRELYNYAKALEDVESGLLGGFYFKHFRLAANVIGSDAKGTMRRAVQALKSTYETPVFPLLDRVRSGLGAKVDVELAHVKGRLMQEIIDQYLKKESSSNGGLGEAEKGGASTGHVFEVCGKMAAEPEEESIGCPFMSKSKSLEVGSAIAPNTTSDLDKSTDTNIGVSNRALDSVEKKSDGRAIGAISKTRTLSLENLYSWKGVPETFQKDIKGALDRFAADLGVPLSARSTSNDWGLSPVAFLDHAFGRIPPAALHAALIDTAALYSLGNPAWDELFGRIMPTAAEHIRRLLGITSTTTPQDDTGTRTTLNKDNNVDSVAVHFGHNSHELISRLLSELLVFNQRESDAPTPPLRVLTTDCEFYSITRQLNRLTEIGAIEVHAVPADPAETFAERCLTAAMESSTSGRPFHLAYLSQVTSLTQQYLLPDLSTFIPELSAALEPRKKENAPNNNSTTSSRSLSTSPLIIIDGYHSFCALPTPLGTTAAQQCCFVSGLIKHAGSGANCAFMTVPRSFKLRPTFTGWLADPSVLGASSTGVHIGSSVNYAPALALQGGTPAFFLPLLTFNHVQTMWEMWEKEDVSVHGIHAHVESLQEKFLDGLRQLEKGSNGRNNGGISTSALVNGVRISKNNNWRSHTLVFELESPQHAAAVVEHAKHGGVLIDNRKQFLRIGFGPNHKTEDVGQLLQALQ